MSLADKVRVLEAIVRTPTYAVVGCSRGRLVYVATDEGESDLWSMDPVRGEKTWPEVGNYKFLPDHVH